MPIPFPVAKVLEFLVRLELRLKLADFAKREIILLIKALVLFQSHQVLNNDEQKFIYRRRAA